MVVSEQRPVEASVVIVGGTFEVDPGSVEAPRAASITIYDVSGERPLCG